MLADFGMHKITRAGYFSIYCKWDVIPLLESNSSEVQ